MDRNQIALALLEAANAALTRSGIHHAVVHGLEGAPLKFGRDVDIMLDRRRETVAMETLEAEFSRQGIPFYRHFNPVGTQQFLFQIAPGTDEAAGFELDFLTRLHLRWGPVLLTHIKDPVRPSGLVEGLSFSPWSSFVKRLFIKTLAGHWKTLDKKRHDWRVEDQDAPIVRERLEHFLGNSYAVAMLQILREGDISELKKLQPHLRRELYKRAAATPRGWWVWVSEELAPLCTARQGAPIFALVGPDGVGKSTVIRLLAERIRAQTCYPKVKIKHWRPGFLPQLGRMKGVRASTPGQAAVQRNKARAFGLVRQIYYTLDFLLGYLLIDRLEGNRLTVLIYDHCFLDMTVHPARFGFPTASAVRFLGRFCRRPDAIVLLRDDPVRIHIRKNELTVGEIARQLTAWERLVRTGHVDKSVSVSLGPDVAAAEIMRFLTAHINPRSRTFSELPQPAGSANP